MVRQALGSPLPAGAAPACAWPGLLAELPTLKEADHLLVAEALARAKGNTSQAARLLGISPQVLHQRLKSRSGYTYAGSN